jgi:2-haloacid dehalogenase
MIVKEAFSLKNLPWLTFDCYDTLVRYTESKSLALEKLVRLKGGDASAIKISKLVFEKAERKLQSGKFLVLNQVLWESLKLAMSAIGFETNQLDLDKIIEAVKEAEPFPDVREALKDLKRDHRLAILSNSEPGIIKYNLRKVEIEFDAVVLASQAECYKPDPAMFMELLNRIDERAKNVTHIAQSFYHDMRATKDLGFGRRIWINRYKRPGDLNYKPDFQLLSLAGVRSHLNQQSN